MTHYGIRFYRDAAHEDMRGCEFHTRNYHSESEAELVARSLLPDVREKHGPKVMYSVFADVVVAAEPPKSQSAPFVVRAPT